MHTTRWLTGGKYATSVQRTEEKQVAGWLISYGGQAQLVQMLKDSCEFGR